MRQSDTNPTDHTAYRAHRQALEAHALFAMWSVHVGEKAAAAQAALDGENGTGKGRKVRARSLLLGSSSRGTCCCSPSHSLRRRHAQVSATH